jgi:dGTPase
MSRNARTTAFQRDRDRILTPMPSAAETQNTGVLIMPLGDHYPHASPIRWRFRKLRVLSPALFNLNEDRLKPSAGHDLGHTPFGILGEDVLNELYHKGFRHNEQSLRVVDIWRKMARGLTLPGKFATVLLTTPRANAHVRQRLGS